MVKLAFAHTLIADSRKGLALDFCAADLQRILQFFAVLQNEALLLAHRHQAHLSQVKIFANPALTNLMIELHLAPLTHSDFCCHAALHVLHTYWVNYDDFTQKNSPHCLLERLCNEAASWLNWPAIEKLQEAPSQVPLKTQSVTPEFALDGISSWKCRSTAAASALLTRMELLLEQFLNICMAFSCVSQIDKMISELDAGLK